jgi:hypothetical protein
MRNDVNFRERSLKFLHVVLLRCTLFIPLIMMIEHVFGLIHSDRKFRSVCDTALTNRSSHFDASL